MITIHLALLIELNAVNKVVEAAIMNWDLPERVKRLSLPSYRYTEVDLKHLNLVVAENNELGIIGVAAWEEADPKDIPGGQTAMLLHGIYVTPSHHHHGIGQQLLQYVETTVQSQCEDLLVKAQADADAFFLAQGMQRLIIENDKRDYANRFWKQLNH